MRQSSSVTFFNEESVGSNVANNCSSMYLCSFKCCWLGSFKLHVIDISLGWNWSRSQETFHVYNPDSLSLTYYISHSFHPASRCFHLLWKVLKSSLFLLNLHQKNIQMRNHTCILGERERQKEIIWEPWKYLCTMVQLQSILTYTCDASKKCNV